MLNGNWRRFECKNIDSIEDVFFDFEMLGLFEALAAAATVARKPQDIPLMDLDIEDK